MKSVFVQPKPRRGTRDSTRHGPIGSNRSFVYEQLFGPIPVGRKGVDLSRPASPDADVWHRVDGLHAGWVALEPDSETEDRLQREYKAGPGGLIGGKRHFDTMPLGYAEHPEGWEALLDIDGTNGLIALIDGVDRFAAESKAVGDAVESLLGG